MSLKIPKFLHQMWIGSLKPPLNLMNSWKIKNPDFEYIYWNEEEFIKRGMNFKCLKQIYQLISRSILRH
jgi:mannosyltransferase OCH1-like enzyme